MSIQKLRWPNRALFVGATMILLAGSPGIPSLAAAQEEDPAEDSAKAETSDETVAKKNKKNDPEKFLGKARTLHERGKYEKAITQYELARAANGGDCFECVEGMFRAAAARGRFEDTAQYAGALLDAAAETSGEEDDKSFAEEVEAVFRRALEETAGRDPDVVWGMIEVLSRLGKASEIARLADRYLKTDDEKALVCAADYRPSLGSGRLLPVAEEINEQLGLIDWDGPLLVSNQIRRPRLRNKSIAPGRGARMSGVVDRTGFLQNVRIVRPPPEKIGMNVRDKVRRALFDTATLRGRRIAVCYPFSVTLPGQTALALAGKGSSDAEGGQLSPLFTLIQGLESAGAILGLVEQAGKNLELSKRAAICAAQSWHDELNKGLVALEWPGPYFDTEEVEDPKPQQTPAPEYTDEAREAAVEGEVVLSVVLSKTGKVVHLEVLETLPNGLAGQAANAVRTWTFEPAMMGGEAVAVCREIRVEFKL